MYGNELKHQATAVWHVLMGPEVWKADHVLCKRCGQASLEKTDGFWDG